MSVQRIHIYGNECKVNNDDAVLDVLDEYHSTLDFEVVPTTCGAEPSSFVLKPLIENDYLTDWPSAVEFDARLEECEDALPEAYLNGEELSDDDWNTYFDVLYEVHEKHGADDFVKMLSALGPYLLSPLTILALRFDDAGQDPVSVCEWHVRPGKATVEVNRFLHSQPITVPG